MLRRHPDNPSAVSVDYLKLLDKDPPGTWLAQPKLDGWRRTAWLENGKWSYQAKHSTGPAAKAMPESLVNAFESIHWPDGLCLDMEWVGLRSNAGALMTGVHSLHAFDMLAVNGDWLGEATFKERYELLDALFASRRTWRGPASTVASVHIVPVQQNPGLHDLFVQQLQDPMSEGIVVRRANSKLIGNTTCCADNPYWLKVKHTRIKDKV